MRHAKVVLGFVCVATLLSCGGIGLFLSKNPDHSRKKSVFQLFSSQHCRIETTDGDPLAKVDCEHLEKFLDPTSSACTRAEEGPLKGYFPEHEGHPIHLCRDTSHPERKNRESIRFIATGDVGAGESMAEGYHQMRVAQAMAAVCPYRSEAEGVGCDFALVSGDLIYPSGVSSVWDEKLKTKFEDMYKRLGELPFYNVPGNHDYEGNVTAQTDYTHFSKRWRMPKAHHAVPDLPDWLTIYGLDTAPVNGHERSHSTVAEQRKAITKRFCAADGWKVAFGHHPPFSNGGHGGNPKIRKFLGKIENECGLDLYVAGHDHHQEHIHAAGYDVLVQGGGGTRLKDVDLLFEKANTLKGALTAGTSQQRFARSAQGFAVVEATRSHMDISFYDISKWNYDAASQSFATKPRADEFIYRCRFSRDDLSAGCRPL